MNLEIFMQVSSDLSIVDLDVPFGLMFAAGASLNAYSNLGVLAVVTWQVLFVIVPMMVLALRLQVILGDLVGYSFAAVFYQGVK
jgi:hypothetical protein